MDVADKFKKVGLLLTEKRFVTVLKEMAGAVVPSVELLGVACKQPAHKPCDG